MKKHLKINAILLSFLTSLLLFLSTAVFAQGLVEVPPMSAEGLPINAVEVYIIEGDSIRVLKDEEFRDFLAYLNLENKGLFNESVFDLKRNAIVSLDEVSDAYYKTYTQEYAGPVFVRWFINVASDKSATYLRGVLQTGKLNELPVLVESGKSKLQVFLNGGFGGFADDNAFFGAGDEFTSGNPVADRPASLGVTSWLEYFLEPGIGGIAGIGDADFYLYGAVSGLISGRIGTDIYTKGSTSFFDVERAYGGFLWTNIGRNNNGKLNVSAGRNFFQLNDGFLFSKYSGSANAGERGSVYLSSRTTFQKTVLATLSVKNWTINGFFLEPQELFPDRQTNINYTGLTAGYNDEKMLDANITVFQRTGGVGAYSLPENQSLEKKGLWVINPKLWLTNILNTGLFFKSEYAYETKSNMQANAWYVGGGIKKNEWKFKPSLYYRYAFMQGDDPETQTYERFDPILTGGLGNWVQGLNYRKVIGTGNIISHRIELVGYLSDKLRVSADAFFLRAHELNNRGGLAPISELTSRDFGQEYSLTMQYNVNRNFLLLSVISGANPGDAFRNNLAGIQPWRTYQLSLFMFL